MCHKSAIYAINLRQVNILPEFYIEIYVIRLHLPSQVRQTWAIVSKAHVKIQLFLHRTICGTKIGKLTWNKWDKLKMLMMLEVSGVEMYLKSGLRSNNSNDFQLNYPYFSLEKWPKMTKLNNLLFQRIVIFSKDYL